MYDVIIPFIEDDVEILKVSIPLIKKNLKVKRIILIGASVLESKINRIRGCEFLCEDNIISGMTYQRIEELLYKGIVPSKNRTGWYFQQFIKLAYSGLCSDEYYLSWDADTIPLNPIQMASKDGTPYWMKKLEFHRPYFETLKELLPDCIPKRKTYGNSFIAEHMLFNAKIVQKMLLDIEHNEHITGKCFYEKILSVVTVRNTQGSTFSEFETYGNYVTHYYPQLYKVRDLHTLRTAARYCSKSYPTLTYLDWAGKSYDIVSFEKRHVSYRLCCLWDNFFIHQLISLESIVGIDQGIFHDKYDL